MTHTARTSPHDSAYRNRSANDASWRKTFPAYCFAALLTAAATTVSGAMLEGEKEGSKVWHQVTTGTYALRIYRTGNSTLNIDRRRMFAWPNAYGYWKGPKPEIEKGDALWSDISGTVEKLDAGGERIVITGKVAGITVTRVIEALPETVTFAWDAKVTDPSPDMTDFSLSGALYDCKDLPFAIETADGKTVSGALPGSHDKLADLKSFTITGPKHRAAFTWPRAQRLSLWPDHGGSGLITARFMFYPVGIEPRSRLMAGDEFGYTIKVDVTPLNPPEPAAAAQDELKKSNPARR